MKKRGLMLIGCGVLALALAGGGAALAYYFVDWHSLAFWQRPAGGLVDDDTETAKPFTLADMEKLEEKNALTADDVDRLLASFRLDDEDARLKAEMILAQQPAKALDPLRARLAFKNAGVRFCAAETLGFMGPAAAPAADDLLKRLGDDDANVRYKSVYALGRTEVRSEAVLIGLVQALADQDAAVRDTALEVLEPIETLPKETVPALTGLLAKMPDQETRRKVLPVLARAGEPAVPAFRAMLKSIKPNNSDPVGYGDYTILLHGLTKLKPAQVKPLLPELSVLLDKENHNSQLLEPELVELIKKCGPDGVKVMAEALKSTQKELIVHQNRLTLLQAIGSLGSEAKVAAPMLTDVLKNNTPKCFPVEYRPNILEALGDIGPAARAAIPAIEPLLQEPGLANDARTALRRLGVIEKK